MGIIYDNGEIIIEHKFEDLYVVGYKADKSRYIVRLDTQDLEATKNWELNFKPAAEVWTHYKEDYSGRWAIVRLYDASGEEAHILEACGDGRFTENDYNSYCAATLESYDAEDELIEAHRIGYVHELGAKWWVW